MLGGAAIDPQINGGDGLIGADGSNDIEGALFTLLSDLPAGTVLTFGAILLIGVFFVTSSDSGSLVMAMIASGGTSSRRTGSACSSPAFPRSSPWHSCSPAASTR